MNQKNSMAKRESTYSYLRSGRKWNELVEQQQRYWEKGRIVRIEWMKSKWRRTALTNYMNKMRTYEIIRRYLMVYRNVINQDRQRQAQEEIDREREQVTQEMIRRIREYQREQREEQEEEDHQEEEQEEEEEQDAQEGERTRQERWGLTRQRLRLGCKIAIFTGCFAVGIYIGNFYLPYGGAIYCIPQLIDRIIDNTLQLIYDQGPDPQPWEEEVINNIRLNNRVNERLELDRWGYLKSLLSFTITLGILVYVGRREPPISSPPPDLF